MQTYLDQIGIGQNIFDFTNDFGFGGSVEFLQFQRKLGFFSGFLLLSLKVTYKNTERIKDFSCLPLRARQQRHFQPEQKPYRPWAYPSASPSWNLECSTPSTTTAWINHSMHFPVNPARTLSALTNCTVSNNVNRLISSTNFSTLGETGISVLDFGTWIGASSDFVAVACAAKARRVWASAER